VGAAAYLAHLWRKVRYSGLTRLVVDGFGLLGISVMPLVVFREGLGLLGANDFDARLAGYTVAQLGPEALGELAALPGRPMPEAELLARLEAGNRCLGVYRGGELVGFTWYDLERCNFRGYPFPLGPGQAYLFDAYTRVAFRGQGVAALIRYAAYRELAALGRTDLYSVSYTLNTPSLKFKRKLNAVIVERGLFVELFRRWRFRRRLGRNSVRGGGG
jgi:GNAT superfamily N-acetyltransferase